MGGEFTFSFSHQNELFNRDFNIYTGIVIPEAVYTWWKNKIKIKTKSSRNILGECFTGGENSFRANET